MLKAWFTHTFVLLGFGTNTSGNSIFGSKPGPGTLGPGLGAGFGTGKELYVPQDLESNTSWLSDCSSTIYMEIRGPDFHFHRFYKTFPYALLCFKHWYIYLRSYICSLSTKRLCSDSPGLPGIFNF